MHIKTLQLKNFRRFEDATFEFGPGFNLLVGENGSGKTSVFDAAFKMLNDGGTFSNFDPNIHKFLDKDIRLKPSEYRNSFRLEKQFPSYCSAIFSFQNNEFGGAQGYEDTAKEIFQLDEIGKFWNGLSHSLIRTGADASPLFLVIDAKRRWSAAASNFDYSSRKTPPASRRDGYARWTQPAVSSEELEAWFYSKTEERFDHDISLNDREYRDELFIVNAAISSFLENCRSLKYMRTHKALIIEWNDKNYIPFDILSDGQRGLIAMVADIARRACLLNPHLGENVLKDTPGIVLIDELDLHLHPKWQRSIVKKLKQTFPKIQFIATTHSPQIIGECKTDEIDRVIRVTEQGGELVHNAYGKDSNAVLRSVMGAEDRDPEITKLLEELFNHIDEDEFDEARGTIEKLREAKAESIYEITEAEHLIARYERENKELSENNEAAE